MTFTYVGDLSTDLDKIRFNVQDTVESSGPKPGDGNFTDEEIAGAITQAGDWERAVAVLFEALAAVWTRHADIRVGPRQQSFSQVAGGFRKQAEKWKKDHNIQAPITVAGWIPVDGYSDDVTTDDVETDSEYETKFVWGYVP